MTVTAVSSRPLVVTDDPDQLDELVRLAAVAGVEPQVCGDPGADRAAWASAPLVVVSASTVRRCIDAGLVRRSGVVVVGGGDEEYAWAAAAELGADHVVFLPAAEPWLLARFADSALLTHALAPCVAVIGGRGGAGATVLASALAVTAARSGRRPLLIDADPLGGGIDLVLGGEDTAGLRWPDLSGTSGRVSPPALRDALPRFSELSVLSWDRGDQLEVPPDAMDAVLESGRQGADLVVVDLPRRVDEAGQRVLHAATSALLVVPAEVRACAAAARVATGVSRHCGHLEVVVRGPAPHRLRAREVARALGVPLAGVLRPEPGLAAALDRGEVPAARARSPLAAFCSQLLDRPDLAVAA